MQRWVKRAVLDLQDISSGALDVFGDLVSMSGSEQQSPQDQHVERALKKFDPG
jgi:hypothetical protein